MLAVFIEASSGDLVLSLLGDRELSGRVLNTRLVIRKCRSGRQGEEYPFGVREVELPEPDEDGDPVTTLVIQWGQQESQSAGPSRDPWEENRLRRISRFWCWVPSTGVCA